MKNEIKDLEGVIQLAFEEGKNAFDRRCVIEDCPKYETFELMEAWIKGFAHGAIEHLRAIHDPKGPTGELEKGVRELLDEAEEIKKNV